MTALGQQAKALVGLAVVVLGSLAVSIPDARWVQVTLGVATAVSTYLAVYWTPNAAPEEYDPKHD